MSRQPTKKAERKRNDRIEVVLNEEEKLKIIKMAEDEGLPVSTWVRWKLLKKS